MIVEVSKSEFDLDWDHGSRLISIQEMKLFAIIEVMGEPAEKSNNAYTSS